MNTDNSIQPCEPIAPKEVINHPAWQRLLDQCNWYDTKSIKCQRRYKTIKMIQILLSVSIPVFSLLDAALAKWLTASSGATIAFLEGLLHMNQYATLWITYRSTAEQLKHEKFLFLSHAGPYRNMQDSERLMELAERVEEHVSSEHANWFQQNKRATVEKAKTSST